MQQTEREREIDSGHGLPQLLSAVAALLAAPSHCQRLSATALERASVLSSAFPLVLFLFLFSFAAAPLGA